MEPRDLEKYLDDVVLKIEETGGEFIESPAVFLIESETIGSLDASMRYHDGSRLEIR